jgi:hypothetical protein
MTCNCPSRKRLSAIDSRAQLGLILIIIVMLSVFATPLGGDTSDTIFRGITVN